MKLIFWHVAGRFYEARSLRAFNRYLRLKKMAEKFFLKVGGSD